MADAVGTFSGLSSGIQWRDMVTQIIAIESKRLVDPLTTRQTKLSSSAAAWSEFRTVAATFRDAAKAVRDATVFNTFNASVSKSSSTSRELVSLTTSTSAAPGAYSLEVQQLASAEKLGGAVATTAATALGVTGSFAINSKTVTVTATDTLTTLRDKVNALNSGSTPSGVSASILQSSAGARLVLSADQTGAAGIELVDDDVGTLTSLGFTDTSVVSNVTSDGYTQTNRLSSSTTAFATMLGIPLPTPSTIKVGGQTITVDLTVDSLSLVAARINAATGTSDAASVVTETVGGSTYSRLRTSLAVEADAADAANSARTLAVLGFTSAGRSGIAQVVKSANTFTDAGNGSANAASGTLLSALQVGGQSLGIAAGDTVTISGKRGDGTTVTRTLTVAADSTMASLLDSANNVSSGYGSGSRTAALSLSSGKLVLTDSVAGDSQLTMSITVAKASGTTISLGSISAANGGSVGRNREISSGTDSRFLIDGQVVTRNTNNVSDVVSGVTFNLLAAEEGTTVSAQVTRNFDDAVSRMQNFTAAYNEVRAWADANLATGKRLAGNTALKSMVNTLSASLLQNVVGLSGSYTAAATAGLSRDKYGLLTVDTSVLKSALTTNFEDVRNLFSAVGIPSDAEVSYVGGGDTTQPTATPYAVVITQAASVASVTGSVFATYATAGTPDTMTVTDVASGRTGTVTLTNGDSIDKVVANLNAAFTNQKMSLVASNSSGRVSIVASDYGTTGGFTVAYTPGTGNGTAQLGISATSYAGLDVAGTIDGATATGSGQTLLGADDTAVEGLRLKYTGTTARTAGTVAYSVGVGGMLYNAASSIARELDGQAVVLANTATAQADAMAGRISDAQDRLARRRTAMIAQFVAMESAMNRAQALSTTLTSQINGLFQYNKQS
jgi:flagellar hook-associated protein 2